MKLELKHLAPYLPYGLKFLPTHYNRDKKIDTLYYLSTIYNSEEFGVNGYTSKYIKPILRPLSDLFKLIDWDKNGDPYMIGYKYGIEKVFEDGEEFYANEYYADYCESPKCYVDIISFDWWLFEHHFDVFGLIEKGLAIDINTLNK